MRFLLTLIVELCALLSFNYGFSQDTIAVKHVNWRINWEYRGSELNFKQLEPLMQTDSTALRYYKKSRASRILSLTFAGIGVGYTLYWGIDAYKNEPNYYHLIPIGVISTISWSFAFNAGRKVKKARVAFNNKQRL